MKKFNVYRRGYSLLEAVIAVGVITIMISIGISTTMNSAATESTNRDYLIASALAQEGLEIMKNIYATNVLKFGEENSYRCAPVRPNLLPTEIASCDINWIGDGFHTVSQIYEGASIHGFDLSVATPNDMIGATEIVDTNRLYLKEYCLGQGDLNACSEDLTQVYTTSSTGAEPSNYFRQIYTVSNSGTGLITISSTVAWYGDNGRIQKVQTDSNLTF
jgi:type II secretory pathway pseudopilin PulG